MFIDSPVIRSTITALADEYPGIEVGGCVIDGKAIQLANLAADPAKAITMDLAGYYHLCQCIWHTHTADGRDGFSVEDIKASRQIGIPYLLYTANKTWHYYDPHEVKPFIGRKWDWVHQNCYDLLRDWVLTTFSYRMNEFYLSSESAWQTEDVGYVANLPSEGFKRIDPANLQENDIILMQVETQYPNHVGILVDGPKNLMLHHLAGQLSQQSIYGGHWRKATHSVWRFVG